MVALDGGSGGGVGGAGAGGHNRTISYDYKSNPPAFAVKHPTKFNFFAKKSRPDHRDYPLSIFEPVVRFGVKENVDSPERLQMM